MTHLVQSAFINCPSHPASSAYSSSYSEYLENKLAITKLFCNKFLFFCFFVVVVCLQILFYFNSGQLIITRLEYDQNSASVMCYSTGGPVTDVQWNINGFSLNDSVYSEFLVVANRTEGTYVSVLTANNANALIGVVTCTVENSHGESRRNITVDSECL